MYKFDLDIMVDLETVGIEPGCGILSIGACTMDGSRTFYAKVNINTCYANGLTSAESTLKWWLQQEQAAYDEAFSGEEDIVTALRDLELFIRSIGATAVWGNGATFDCSIIHEAARRCKISPVYNSYSDRCYRTLKNLYPEIQAGAFVGTKHNSLHDAQHQAQHARRILSYIQDSREEL